MTEKLGLTIRNTGDMDLINRVAQHIGEEYLDWTPSLVAGYVDGGSYGGVPDPRSRATMAVAGEVFARGGGGPKSKKGLSKKTDVNIS